MRTALLGFFGGLLLGAAFPLAACAEAEKDEAYGVGLLCPRADTQASFYTESNQQDASGTLGFDATSGFTLTSDTIKTLKAAGAHVMPSFCDAGAPGIRIDSKRDGWLQAGMLWLPPNQEWDYSDWQDTLRKAAIWKPLGPVALLQGTQDAPAKDRPYPEAILAEKTEIYPIKFTDDGAYALVLVDESGDFAKSCAGTPSPPQGAMGWMRLSSETGGPVAVPTHPKGC